MGIKYENAKAIYRVFKKEGRVIKRNTSQTTQRTLSTLQRPVTPNQRRTAGLFCLGVMPRIDSNERLMSRHTTIQVNDMEVRYHKQEQPPKPG